MDAPRFRCVAAGAVPERLCANASRAHRRHPRAVRPGVPREGPVCHGRAYSECSHRATSVRRTVRPGVPREGAGMYARLSHIVPGPTESIGICRVVPGLGTGTCTSSSPRTTPYTRSVPRARGARCDLCGTQRTALDTLGIPHATRAALLRIHEERPRPRSAHPPAWPSHTSCPTVAAAHGPSMMGVLQCDAPCCNVLCCALQCCGMTQCALQRSPNPYLPLAVVLYDCPHCNPRRYTVRHSAPRQPSTAQRSAAQCAQFNPSASGTLRCAYEVRSACGRRTQ
jgi:hypothetical protein